MAWAGLNSKPVTAGYAVYLGTHLHTCDKVGQVSEGP